MNIYYKDNKDENYLLNVEQDQFYDYEDYFYFDVGIHFLGGMTRDYSDIAENKEVSKIIDNSLEHFTRKDWKNKKEYLDDLTALTEQIKTKLERKGFYAIPFGAYRHSGTWLLPFRDTEAQKECYHWNGDGTNLAGFMYSRKKLFKNKEEANDYLKEKLEVFNDVDNGEVYNLALYKVVPNGANLKKCSVERIDGVLVYSEPIDTLGGILGKNFDDYKEGLIKEKGFKEVENIEDFKRENKKNNYEIQ